MKEAENGGITVTSRMTVENRDSERLPLILYLNPGFVISSVTVDGQTVTFQRDQQVFLVNREVLPGETKEVIVNYEGKIDNSFCFLDTPEGKYASPAVNTIDIYRFGNTPAFCEKEYKLLTPECVWYPVSVPPYATSGFRRVMFTRYMLEVDHAPNLVAICQGEANRETPGKTTFTFEHDMQGISLCVGNYKKREITVGSDAVNNFQDPKKMPVKDDRPTRIELFYLPGHEYMLDIYDNIPREEWPAIIESAKNRISFYGENNNYVVKRLMGKMAFDPTLQNPYRWITLVEVPCDFHVFTGNALQVGERTQGGMVFLPEKTYTENVSSFSNDARVRLNEEFEPFHHGSCDLKTTGMSNTCFVYSGECPLVNDLLLLLFNPRLIWVRLEADVEYFVVDYMKDHSLEEALSDPSLSPGLLDKIIRRKCAEFNAFLTPRIGKKEFHEAYHDFLKQHLFEETTFEETTFEEFSREIFARFDVRLDSMVMNWYRNNKLPAFEIDGHTITMKGRGYSIYDLKIFNRGKVPGIIRTNDDQPGWIIPPGEGRAIRTRIREANDNLYTYLSLNIPNNIKLPNEVRTDAIGIDTTTWFLPLDSNSFSTGNENEIIVDNEDPGFTIHETRKFAFAFLLGKVEARAKYYKRAPVDHWGFTIREACYGSFVKGAYFKKGGKGNQKVQWETNLPEGKYEVFCYQPNDGRNVYPEDFISLREYYYTVFDGKEEHEVVLSMDKDDWNWRSLGVFNFHGKGRVTLSDKDRKHDFANGNYTPQDVVADAIKWVKIQE